MHEESFVQLYLRGLKD